MNQDQIAQDAQRIEDERLRVQEEKERLRREEEELLSQEGVAPRGQRAHRRGAGPGGKEAAAAGAIPGGPTAHRARFGFSAAGKGFGSSSPPAASGARFHGSSGFSGGGSGKAVGIGLLAVAVAAAAIYFGTSGKVDPKQVTQVAAQWLNGNPDRGAAEPRDAVARTQDSGPAPTRPGPGAPAEPKLPSVEPTVATPTSDGSVDPQGAATPDAAVDVAQERGAGQMDHAAADAEGTPAASGSSHGLTPIAMRDAASPEIMAKLAAIESRLDLIQAQMSSSATSAQRQQVPARPRPSTPAARSRSTSGDPAAAAKPTPAAEARSRAGQLLAVDVWGGVPSVVVGTGESSDRRTRVLRPGDSHNGVSLLHADPVTGQATFSAAGTTFTMNVKEGG